MICPHILASVLMANLIHDIDLANRYELHRQMKLWIRRAQHRFTGYYIRRGQVDRLAWFIRQQTTRFYRLHFAHVDQVRRLEVIRFLAYGLAQGLQQVNRQHLEAEQMHYGYWTLIGVISEQMKGRLDTIERADVAMLGIAPSIAFSQLQTN